MRATFRMLVPLCILVLGVAVGAAPAVAAPVAAAPAQHHSVTMVSRMRLIGVDAAVAKAHGFSTQRAVQPDNTVYGDCGSSYVTVTPVGNLHALIQTGFTVNENAVEYSWTVHVVDDYGVSDKHWSGGLAFRTSWIGTNNFHSSGTGWVFVSVTSGIAIMWNGDICFSEGPWAQAYIY